MGIFKKKKQPLKFAYRNDGVITQLDKNGNVIEEDVCMIEKLGCVEFEPAEITRRNDGMKLALMAKLAGNKVDKESSIWCLWQDDL